MKKISVLFLAITLVLASCKNYDDEFTALNESIAALQTQVAGFSSLQASLTTLQSSVSTLQAAVNAIPTDLVDLSGLEGDMAGLSAGLTTALANITALQADLNAIIAAVAANQLSIADAQASIDALAAALVTAQADIDELLAANNVYDGNLTIASAAQLAFAVGLDDKVMIINGFLTIDTDGLSAAAVAAVTSKILNVTGTVTADNTTDGGVVDLSALTAIGGNVAVTGTADVDFSSLTSVVGSYNINGFDITDDALTTVGGAVTLNYDGGYSQPNLASAASLALTDYTTTGTTIVGNLMVDFSGLTVTTPVTATTTFASATSVKISNAYSSIIAPDALTVDMLAANYTALTISATEAGSVITIAGTVYSAGTTGGPLSVTGSATSIVNAAGVTKVSTLAVTAKTVDFTLLNSATSTIGLTSTTAVSLPALTTAGAITANTAVTFNAPLLVSAGVTVGAATDVTLASSTTANLTAGAVENLTFTALTAIYADAAAETVHVTGKVAGAGDFSSTSAALTTATLGGKLVAASLSGNTLLTSVTTSGVINSFTLNAAPILTAVSLAHTHIIGGAGSTLIVTGNAALTTLTTSTDYALAITVTGNTALATMDFSSYATTLLGGTATINVNGNGLVGTFTAPAAATATTAFVEATITQASLTTLSTYVAAIQASAVTLALNVNISDVDGTPTTLAAALTASLQAAGTNPDYAQTPLFGTAVTVLIADTNPTSVNHTTSSFTKLDSAAEFALIQ
jgi:hypothetical protein